LTGIAQRVTDFSAASRLLVQEHPMRPAFTRGAAIIAIVLLAACGGSPTTTQPSQAAPTAPPGKATLVDLRVDGQASVPPGESAQYTATATYSDRSSRDVTADAKWTSTNDSVLSVTATGAMTTHVVGLADVIATLGTLSHSREVVVVPEGRYLVKAFVNEDQVTAMIYDVRVEVVSGPAAGLAATTDWNGMALLYGVPADAQLRFTKDGYDPVVDSVRVDHNWFEVRVPLASSSARPNLPGGYQLTINSGPCVDGTVLPDQVRTRVYGARIWNAGAKVMVELDGANFALQWCPICHETRGNRFTGQAEVLDARFTLDQYSPPSDWNDGVYPNVVEQLPDGRLLAIAGHAIVAPTPDGFAGTLDGSIAIYGSLSLGSGASVPAASCQSSSHQFVLRKVS
jgi:hypothetical protein